MIESEIAHITIRATILHAVSLNQNISRLQVNESGFT